MHTMHVVCTLQTFVFITCVHTRAWVCDMHDIHRYSNSFYRAGRKPFNPLLGETFDFVDQKRKFRFVSEQVSHHPPISASFAQSEKWEVSQESGGESKFRGTCLKIKPTGRIRVKLLPSGAIFEWCKVCRAHGSLSVSYLSP